MYGCVLLTRPQETGTGDEESEFYFGGAEKSLIEVTKAMTRPRQEMGGLRKQFVFLGCRNFR